MILYVVLVDWGTMDGFPHNRSVDSVWVDGDLAAERRDEVKNRTPFPAVYAEVIECPLANDCRSWVGPRVG